MTSVRIKWLVACAALGLGEYVASLAPEFAGLWPTTALLLVLVVLFGYGFRLSCWPAAACFLLGIALFLQASVQSEENYRLRPWMRGRRTHVVSRQSDLSLRVKRDLARRLSLGLEHDREAAALNRAILLGDRAALPQKTKRMFVDSGALHVFAVSGLHVMSVVQAFCLFAAFLFVPRRFVGLAVLPLVWGYVWAIGWPPSAVRAVLMASFFLIAPLFWRRADGIMAWALTYLIVHVARPLMVSNVGNALSFAVMLAILLADDYARRVEAKFLRALWITGVAWMASVPIAAHVFGRVTPGGIVSNLVLVTTAECTVLTGVAGVLASFVCDTLAVHVNNLSALFTRAMVFAADSVSRLPGGSFEVPPWGLWECAGWYAAVVLLLYLVHSVSGRRRFL